MRYCISLRLWERQEINNISIKAFSYILPNVEFLKSLPYTFYSFLVHVHSLNLFIKHWTQSHAIDFSHQGRASPLENIKAYETVEKAQNIRIYFLNGYFATCMRIMVQFFFLILGVYKIVLYNWTTAGFSFASRDVCNAMSKVSCFSGAFPATDTYSKRISEPWNNCETKFTKERRWMYNKNYVCDPREHLPHEKTSWR